MMISEVKAMKVTIKVHYPKTFKQAQKMEVTYGKWLYFWNSRVSVWGYLLRPSGIQWGFSSVRIWKSQKSAK